METAKTTKKENGWTQTDLLLIEQLQRLDAEVSCHEIRFLSRVIQKFHGHADFEIDVNDFRTFLQKYFFTEGPDSEEERLNRIHRLKLYGHRVTASAMHYLTFPLEHQKEDLRRDAEIFRKELTSKEYYLLLSYSRLQYVINETSFLQISNCYRHLRDSAQFWHLDSKEYNIMMESLRILDEHIRLLNNKVDPKALAQCETTAFIMDIAAEHLETYLNKKLNIKEEKLLDSRMNDCLLLLHLMDPVSSKIYEDRYAVLREKRAADLESMNSSDSD